MSKPFRDLVFFRVFLGAAGFKGDFRGQKSAARQMDAGDLILSYLARLERCGEGLACASHSMFKTDTMLSTTS